MTNYKICSVCNEEKEFTQFPKNSTKPNGISSECKLCKSRLDKEYRRQNKHKLREYFKQHYIENKEKKVEQVKQWQEDNWPKVLSYKAKYRSKNPSRCKAIANKRAKNKSLRTPNWLTKEQFIEIEKFYELAILLTAQSGELHHVDHIVPLNGEKVSGLHVPWNLQVLTATENMKKSNKFEIN